QIYNDDPSKKYKRKDGIHEIRDDETRNNGNSQVKELPREKLHHVCHALRGTADLTRKRASETIRKKSPAVFSDIRRKRVAPRRADARGPAGAIKTTDALQSISQE